MYIYNNACAMVSVKRCIHIDACTTMYCKTMSAQPFKCFINMTNPHPVILHRWPLCVIVKSIFSPSKQSMKKEVTLTLFPTWWAEEIQDLFHLLSGPCPCSGPHCNTFYIYKSTWFQLMDVTPGHIALLVLLKNIKNKRLSVHLCKCECPPGWNLQFYKVSYMLDLSW